MGRQRLLQWAALIVCGLLLLTWLPVLALRWLEPPTTAFMLFDPDARVDLDYEWMDWSSIGSSVPLAVLASEDQKFPTHFGFDIESIRGAIDDSQRGGRLRGASTISQQVAKNLFLWNGRSFVRKGIEAYFTVLIEATWPKQRILEVYVNVAEFGPGVFGVGAASRRFFAESPSSMGDAQAALLAAVLPNPKRLRADQPSAYVRERQSWILGQMQRLRRERVLASLN
ncbi:MAG: monofunctional biosynthetic peptidoglycan transglycosylase [Gammaproteobacteria bacterium]|nr:monofunctional biosynthetic peptidoglycan transglycosylase [Gammaproteobacteria bacterium]MDH3505845.1 monofunctional biosynthetic peptidoglycan transglycosylase [Gammaproteobacteria bacterium]